MRIVRHGRIRSAISLVLTAAMLASLIVMPAFAEPIGSVPTLIDAGTTGVTSVSGTDTAGYNGVYEVDIAAEGTKSKFEYDGVESSAATLGAEFGITDSVSATVTVALPNGASETAASSFTSETAVSEVVDWVDGMAHIAATITAEGTATAEHVLPGNFGISLDDGGTDVLPGIFGSQTFGGYSLTPSSDYGDWTTTFTPDGGNAVQANINAVGILEGGEFVSKVDTATGEYTALLFDNGFLAVAPAGLKSGTLTIGAGAGVREPVTGMSGIEQGDSDEDWQAGVVETLTVGYVAPLDGLGAVNGLMLDLPEGFEIAGPAAVEGMAASQTVSADGTRLTLDKFVIGDTMVTFDVPVTNATEVRNAPEPSEARDRASYYGYGDAVLKSRNVGGSAFTTETVTTLHVLPNKQARISGFNPERINAGGQTLINGVIKDIYGNVDGYWAHSLQFSIAAPSADATMVSHPNWNAAESQIDTMSCEYGEFHIWLQTATTSGINTVTVSADRTGAAPKAFTVDTAGIGDPYKLEVFTTTGGWSFADTDTAEVGVRIVDAAGNPSSFTEDMWFNAAGEFGVYVDWWFGSGAWDFFVPAGHSASENQIEAYGWAFDSEDKDDVISCSAEDPFGTIFSADYQMLRFLETSEYVDVYRVLITPDESHQVKDWDASDGFWRYFSYSPNWDSVGPGDTPDSFGYAKATGEDAIQYTGQLVDELDRPVKLAGQVVTLTVGAFDAYENHPWPGKLSTKTAVTDANGQFTFSATSTKGSLWTNFEDDPMWDEVHDNARWYPNYDESYFTPISADVTCTDDYRPDEYVDGYAFAYFSAPEYDGSWCDPYTAKADGVDAVTYKVAYEWSMLDQPAEGVEVSFNNYDYVGDLSALTAATDAEGVATVDITSTEPGYGYVYSYDKFGGYASSEYYFGDYGVEVELLNPDAGTNVYQGGSDTYVDVKVTVVDSQGDPVNLQTEAYRPNYGWVSPELYTNGEWDNVYLEYWDRQYADTDDGEVVTGFTARLRPMHGGYTQDTDIEEFLGTATGRLGVWGSKSAAGLQSEWVEAVEGDFSFEVVNNATVSCEAVADSWSEFELKGGGFFSSGPNSVRDADVSILVNGTWIYNYYAEAKINGDGDLYESEMRIKEFYGYDGDNWGYWTIGEGTYDLMIDGLIFPDALVVAPRPDYDLKVNGIAEGQVFAPGKVPTSLFVAGQLDDPLYWCEIWIDGVKLGDSNENPGESTVFTGLNMSFLKPGKHTLQVEWESWNNWGLKDITFYVKAPATLTAKASTVPSYNALYTVSGKLAASGASVANQAIVIERSSNGTIWSAFKTATTNSTGGYSFTAQSTATTYFRVKFAGSDGAKSATAYLTVKPKAVLNKPVVGLTQAAGKTFSFHSVLTPKHTAGAKSVSVYVYKWNGSKWVYVKQVAAINYSLTSATKAVGKTSLAKGTYRLRARHADGSHAITWSAYSNTFKVK